jgi:spore coat protein U-like protein
MNTMNLRHTLIVVLLLLVAWVPKASWAANNCPGATVTATAFAFGAYDAVTGAAVTSSATVTVTCGGGGTGPIISIQLNAGLNSAGSFNPRVMKSTTSTDTLNYNLFVNTSYIATNIWGDGTSGTQDPGGNTSGVNGANTLVKTVNGQIPANQDPSGACPATPCTYNDTVTITVNF